jgi:hypothetical protein
MEFRISFTIFVFLRTVGNWMKRYCFVLLAVLVSGYVTAQNLVPNPSFETMSSVPTTFGQMANATGWYNANGSCDLFHTSGGSGSVGIPANYFGNQTARTGSAYAGIAASNSNSYHEYMGVTLTSPLTIGQLYYCEAYVSAGEGPYRYGTNNFGFRFSTGALMGSAGDPPISGGAQVNWATPITNYTGWVQVSGTFTATAANTHLTLGNFYSVAATTWSLLGTAGSINSQYWFIEDVVVQPSVPFDMPAHTFTARPMSTTLVGLDWEFGNVDGFREFSLQRSVDDGDTWEQFARIPASQGVLRYNFIDRPDVWGQEIQYTLRKVAEDGAVAYSEVRRVTLDFPMLEQSISLGPNPVQRGDVCGLGFAAEGATNVEWMILDLSGKVITQGEAQVDNGQGQVLLETASLAPGTYMVRVISGNQVATRKLAVM